MMLNPLISMPRCNDALVSYNLDLAEAAISKYNVLPNSAKIILAHRHTSDSIISDVVNGERPTLGIFAKSIDLIEDSCSNLKFNLRILPDRRDKAKALKTDYSSVHFYSSFLLEAESFGLDINLEDELAGLLDNKNYDLTSLCESLLIKLTNRENPVLPFSVDIGDSGDGISISIYSYDTLNIDLSGINNLETDLEKEIFYRAICLIDNYLVPFRVDSDIPEHLEEILGEDINELTEHLGTDNIDEWALLLKDSSFEKPLEYIDPFEIENYIPEIRQYLTKSKNTEFWRNFNYHIEPSTVARNSLREISNMRDKDATWGGEAISQCVDIFNFIIEHSNDCLMDVDISNDDLESIDGVISVYTIDSAPAESMIDYGYCNGFGEELKNCINHNKPSKGGVRKTLKYFVGLAFLYNMESSLKNG